MKKVIKSNEVDGVQLMNYLDCVWTCPEIDEYQHDLKENISNHLQQYFTPNKSHDISQINVLYHFSYRVYKRD